LSKHKKYNNHEQENIILHPQWQPALPERPSTAPFAPVPGEDQEEDITILSSKIIKFAGV
jgi:hypothetical protein